MKIGAKIRELRNAKGMTQEELADKLNVSVQTVSRWENGVNCPDISMLPVLAEYFHTTTDNLLGLERRSWMKLLNAKRSGRRKRRWRNSGAKISRS